MEEKEFQGILERQKDRVYRLAWSYCPSEAEDVFQEVFLQLWRKGPTFPDQARERAWLLRVTANACKSRLRAPWRKRVVELNETIPAPEKGESLLELVGRLPPKYRAVIHLYYYEDCPVAECARILSISETAVQTRLQRAREKLKDFLEKEEQI